MYSLKRTFKPTVFFLSLLAVTATSAAEAVRYAAKFGSQVKIEGTSNIHDWTVKGQIVTGSIEVNRDFEKDLASITPPPTVRLTIPVRSLKSGNRKMDEVMQEHMHMSANPKIEYQLKAMSLVSSSTTFEETAEYMCTGDLTVSGQTRSITMPVTIQRVEDGNLKIHTSIVLKMTDFGISPPAPKLAMGLIKTGDEVKLQTDWFLAKRPANYGVEMAARSSEAMKEP